MDTEFFNWYFYMATLELTVFKVSPYTQWVIWSRPEESSQPFDVNFFANTYLELLTLKTEIIEDAKVCKISIYDYVKDTQDSLIPDFGDANDCGYNPEYEVKYYDNYWNYDIGTKILGDSEWYGQRAIYNYWVLDKYTW